jgi:hypothetical protein
MISPRHDAVRSLRQASFRDETLDEMLKSLSCMSVADCAETNPGRVTVVSGLPRSGTSMMMRVLDLGGIEALSDNVRAADSRNPYGYYEWEAVKTRTGYSKWMDAAAGKSLKVVSRFIAYLPATHCYDILFLNRDIESVLWSQADLASHVSETVWSGDNMLRLKELYQRHVDETLDWIDKRPNMRVREFKYETIIERPAQEVRRICDFLASRVLCEGEMLAAIDPALQSAGRKTERMDA